MRWPIFTLTLACLLPTAVWAEPATTKHCLSNQQIRSKQMVVGQGYFVRTTDGWWHNMGEACAAYGPGRALATDSNNNRQCSGDMVTVFASSGVGSGTCRLGSWEKVDGPPDAAAR